MISLRHATMEDADRLLAWRNDPQTIALSNTPHAIPLDEHLAWLHGKLADDGCKLFIASNGSVPVGMVRFDARDEDVEIGLAVDPQYRLNGVAKKIIRQSCEGAPYRIIADIRRCNFPSLGAFQACGFTFLEYVGDDIIRMAK